MSIRPAFTFGFNAGKSFLAEVGHPITVPREQVDYTALQASGLNRKRLLLILPRGECDTERYYTLYDHTAGYGPYHQLQMRGEDRTLPPYLKIGERLVVLLFSYGQHSFVALEYREPSPGRYVAST